MEQSQCHQNAFAPEKAKNENNVKHIKVKQRFPNPKNAHSYANGRQIN